MIDFTESLLRYHRQPTRSMLPYEKALLDYYLGDSSATFQLYRSDGYIASVHISNYFESFNLPLIEERALELCTGRVLDAGAGTGRHSKTLTRKSHNVVSIDSSQTASEIMINEGLVDVRCVDFFDIEGDKFDTILLLNRGIGMAKKIRQLPKMLDHCKSLLNLGGKLIVDSCKIIEMNKSKACITDNYYGEVTMRIDYKGEKGPEFEWLYVEHNLLKKIATACGWNFNLIIEAKDDYLCTMSLL